MADYPALPLWTDAYLADTAHLTDDEHGRYLLLLITIWRAPDCRIPNDDMWLARRFRRSTDEVHTLFRPLIREFCQSDGNWISQKRLTKERSYVEKASKQRSDAAKARWNKEKRECERNAAPHSPRNAPTPTPTPIIPEEILSSGAVAPAAPDKPVFDLGREILGKSAGGQIKKLIGHHRGDLDAAMGTLRRSAGKSSPAAYIAAILNGNTGEDAAAETAALYKRLGVI